MDNNMGENMYNPNFGQAQPGYDQSQMQYQNMQPGYDQLQMQYQNMQPGFDQSQMQYQNMQPGYNQAQMQYQNTQQPYGQPMGYNQQMYSGQQGYQTASAPRKPIVINKKIIIIAAAVLAVVLAIVFIPKLFNKDKIQPPFKHMELGLTMDEVVDKYDIDDKDAHVMDAYKSNVKGFGVEGDLQFCFSDDTLYMVNWYVYEYDNDEDDVEKAIEEAEKYYTDKYGEPEIEDNKKYDEVKYVWEYEGDAELELVIGEDYIVLRIVDFSLL